MQLHHFSKKLLLGSLLLLFTACGGGNESTPSLQSIAISKIEAYAQSNTNPKPTLQDYIDAGVDGVTSENLDNLNSVVDGLEAEDVDTVEEINALASDLGINLIPIATAQSITLDEDTSTAITLAGTDSDGDALTYSIVTQPTNGTLTGTAPNMTYTPTANYFGSDSFTFKANDGKVDSATATVSITVTDVAEPNVAPLATAQTVTLDEDTSKAITLAGTDSDGDALTYTIVTQPTNGTLSGTAPNITYTPTANYFGSDSFTFKVNDGTVDSGTATVSITVNAALAVLANATAQIYTKGTAITTLVFDNTGGDVTACSVSPALPVGLSLALNNGTCELSGTLTAVATIATYTVTGTNVTGDATATVSIWIISPPKKTGQTKSYDQTGNEVADGTQRDDGHYQKGTTPSYTRDDTEIVTDNLTGLLWQDDASVASVQKQWLTDANYATCNNDNTDPACFDTTGDTATTYCTELVLGGHEDWRLPSSTELEGIVNYGARNSAIDDTKFYNTASSNYWSSTSFVGFEDDAWNVDFYYGDVGGGNKDNNLYVRCVRDGQ